MMLGVFFKVWKSWEAWKVQIVLDGTEGYYMPGGYITIFCDVEVDISCGVVDIY